MIGERKEVRKFQVYLKKEYDNYKLNKIIE